MSLSAQKPAVKVAFPPPPPAALVPQSFHSDPHHRKLSIVPTSLAKGSQVDSFQSNSQGNQPIVYLPLSQPIPDSVPSDVKHLLQKFSSILRTGVVVPNPSHGVEHQIHSGGDPPSFC